MPGATIVRLCMKMEDNRSAPGFRLVSATVVPVADPTVMSLSLSVRVDVESESRGHAAIGISIGSLLSYPTGRDLDYPLARLSIRRSSATLPSEDRDRVPGRAGPPRKAERQSDDHEFEPALLVAGLHQVLELEAVRREHPHRHDLQRVDRIEHPGHGARHGLAVTVGEEGGNPALVHPRDRVDVQAGLALTRGRIPIVPRTEFQPAPVVPGPEDEDVALAELDTLGDFACLELGTRHGITGFEPLDAQKSWQVEEDAPADQSVPIGGDVQGGRALRGQDLLGWQAVVGLALVGDVTESVDMGLAVAVAGHPEIVQAESQPMGADVDVVSLADEMQGGAGIVRSRDHVDGDLHRDLSSGANETGGLTDLLRGDVVEGPELVVRAPPAPVLARLADRVERRRRHRGALGRGGHERLSPLPNGRPGTSGAGR